MPRVGREAPGPLRPPPPGGSRRCRSPPAPCRPPWPRAGPGRTTRPRGTGRRARPRPRACGPARPRRARPATPARPRPGGAPGAARWRSVTGHPQHRSGPVPPVGADHPADGVEQHGQSLALLVAAEEEGGRPRGRPRLGPGEPGDLHAVEEDLVAPAECGRRRGGRRLGHRTAQGQPPGQRSDDRCGQGVEGAPAAPVEGPHQRREAARDQEGVGNSRGERFVDVHDVDGAVPERAPTARWAARGERATGATEPFARTPDERPASMKATPVGVSRTRSIGALTVTSCPSAPSERASPSTWPWTPPGLDRL